MQYNQKWNITRFPVRQEKYVPRSNPVVHQCLLCTDHRLMIPGPQIFFTLLTELQSHPSPPFSTALGSSYTCSGFSFGPLAWSHSYSCLDVWPERLYSAISYHVSPPLEIQKRVGKKVIFISIYVWQKEHKSCKVQRWKIRQCQTEFLRASLILPPGEYALWYSFNYKVAYYYFSPGHLLQQGTGWMVLT